MFGLVLNQRTVECIRAEKPMAPVISRKERIVACPQHINRSRVTRKMVALSLPGMTYALMFARLNRGAYLLADTKAREDFSKEIMRGDRAHDLTQKLMGHPAIFCNQLCSDFTAETLLGLHQQFSSLL